MKKHANFWAERGVPKNIISAKKNFIFFPKDFRKKDNSQDP